LLVGISSTFPKMASQIRRHLFISLWILIGQAVLMGDKDTMSGLITDIQDRENAIDIHTARPSGSLSSPSHSSTRNFKRSKVGEPEKDYQCQVCGKTYKHRSCLSKHGWEHHEFWSLTRIICQNKHQQVQLLEAAQVLAEIGGFAA